MARPIRDLNRQPSNVSRHLMYIAWTGLIPAGIFVSPTPLAPTRLPPCQNSHLVMEDLPRPSRHHANSDAAQPVARTAQQSENTTPLPPRLPRRSSSSRSRRVAPSPTLGRLQRLAQLVRGRQMHHAAVWRVPPAGGDDDEAESTPSGE
ncbi:hypothetical protein V8E36_002955 [Tilletia maclaganii]